MKILSIIICGLAIPFLSFSQSDKKAEEILKGVSAKYKSYTSLQAEFTITSENSEKKTKDVQSGMIYLKGNKYKLSIKGQEVFSDGKTIWTYLKEANEVQINEVNLSSEGISPANIFTMYEKGFDFKFIEEMVEDGKTFQIIDIKPQDSKKQFFKIRLTIDKNQKMVASSKIHEKSGTQYTYAIKQFTPNADLKDSMFIFNMAEHPNVDVIDLR